LRSALTDEKSPGTAGAFFLKAKQQPVTRVGEGGVSYVPEHLPVICPD
jgi:hypothetical protein